MPFPPLTELFPDADFGFSMRLRPGDPATFFAPGPGAESVRRERLRWLQEDPARYAALEPAGETLVPPLIAFARGAGCTDLPAADAVVAPKDQLVQLGGCWEPDFLILAPDDGGRFVLRAGCVCFPSGWALEEKRGLPLEEIHGVVPGLNTAVGVKIHQFLARLKPGPGWCRSNWGLSSSAESNQHPARGINRLFADTPPASTWLRLEHQILTTLPGTNAILFGIRLENVSLAVVRAEAAIACGLRRALATMPDAMAAYKNLATIRPALIAYLS